MIIIRMELWPGGDESRKRTLGLGTIANDGTGGTEVGNHDVCLLKSPEYSGNVATDVRRPKAIEIWRRGRVIGYPRTSRKVGPWDLLLRALHVTVGDRNQEKHEEPAGEAIRRSGG